ncbi:hypothetical protein [Alterisphingorhabdus coralli]|uniref:Lipoprotein n=1 Tax=Alterisphingorhabdus coralli TaxID=3071408 RepID=A0AA97F898_9SPHN|nr:hypothetical protein [Parasphingorhabdus sp. SCSIO 66989]WOE74877.1 hypothetical protein RB602_13715 [Parasphingorhabdus sp. SCSIO 66989]
MVKIPSGLIIAPLAAMMLSGCLAKAVADTAVGVVTLPVKAVGAGVDAVTESQSEADEKRGRAMREREERLGKLSRERDKLQEDCADGDDDACDELPAVNNEIQRILSEPR